MSASHRNVRLGSGAPVVGCALDLEVCRGVLHGLPTALLLIDATGRVQLANARAVKVLGFERAEIEGRLVDDVLVPFEELRQSEGSPDGRNRWKIDPQRTIGFTVSRVRLTTGPGFAVVFQDLQRLDRIREERNRLLSLASVGQSLPTVLHELRNPLASITTCLEVMIEDETRLSAELRRELHAVLSEARRMRLSLEGIGSVGRTLRSSRLEAVDFACREAFRVMEIRARNIGIEAMARIDDMPLLPFDTASVRAIVYNLLNNSIQAERPGGSIQLEALLVDEGSALEIVVRDDGCGMDAGVLARCRDLFFTTKPRGSGIGLALCNDAVRGAGGTLNIESTPGHGTVVTVRIPVAPTSTEELSVCPMSECPGEID